MAGLCVAVTISKGQKFALLRIWDKDLTGVWMTGKLVEHITRVSPRVSKERQYSGPIRLDN